MAVQYEDLDGNVVVRFEDAIKTKSFRVEVIHEMWLGRAVTKTQIFCASVTNTPAAKVICRMKRMGSGFGGKRHRACL